MPDKVTRLLKLAETEFPDLTEPEREVVRCTAVGEWANLEQWGPQPAEGKKRKPGGGPLRSSVVEWLCTDASAKRLVHRKGLRIINATLGEELDLERAHVPFLFALHACRLPGLKAEMASFDETVYLMQCRIDGRLDIIGSRIADELLCDGALICGSDGVSIRADKADIGNNVFLHDGFRALGHVQFLGAGIKGQLICAGGTFLNRDGVALSADNAYINGNVFLSERFRALGEVRLPGAKIKGILDCKGGTFLHGEEIAINCQSTTVDDALILEPKRLRGQIYLHSLEIKTMLRMRSTSTAKATLDLRNAKVGVLNDIRDSWPEAGELWLEGFEYNGIDQNSPRSAKERLDWLGRMGNRQFLPQPYEQLAA